MVAVSSLERVEQLTKNTDEVKNHFIVASFTDVSRSLGLISSTVLIPICPSVNGDELLLTTRLDQDRFIQLQTVVLRVGCLATTDPRCDPVVLGYLSPIGDYFA